MTQKLTLKKKWLINKIFSDQLEIAMNLAGIFEHSKYEGEVPEDTKFPNIKQIFEKYSKYNRKDIPEQITPKKTSSKAERLEADLNNPNTIEEMKSPYDLQMSDTKSKMIKQEKLQQKTKIEIENKIQEANITAMNKESKREGSGNNKNRAKVITPYAKIGKSETMNPHVFAHMHHNPHMQLDPRLREGEDKRATSGGRNHNYMPAHSPSIRQPTTAEKYTLFGFSEDSTI